MITIYCAHCHRPLCREIPRVKVRTWTCIRRPVFVRRSCPDGTTYLETDCSRMECSVELMSP